MEEGSIPKYQWMGVLILLVKSESFQTGDETKACFILSRFFQEIGRFFIFFMLVRAAGINCLRQYIVDENRLFVVM